MIGQVTVSEVKESTDYTGKILLLVYVIPDDCSSSLFVISHDENPDLFIAALEANGLIINCNDSDYSESSTALICDLSDLDYKYRNGELDASTYQLYSIMNHRVPDLPLVRYSFDLVSIVSSVP